MPASYSLYELNEYIKRVIALNFPEPIWVHCEIAQIKEVRGNVYLDLVYHDEATNEITAQVSAQIWYKSYLFLKHKLGALLSALLVQGSHVSVKAQIEYNEKYGLKLVIEDIDPAYTMGQMELKRQKILQQLQDEGLTHLNKLTSLPKVIQNFAIISSSKAAGYIDFINHISQNPYGYQFNYQLFEVALQGQNTEREVCRAMTMILETNNSFDCVLIMRGGGSKPDLAWFDNYNIGAAIAKSKIPVITGIGHEIDTTVADIVAFRSIKTPTAVADFVIGHNMDFEASILEKGRWISQLARQILKNNEVALVSMAQMIRILPSEILRQQYAQIDLLDKQIFISAKNKLKYHQQQLELAEKHVVISDPKVHLKRGFAIIRQNDKIVQRAQHFKHALATEIEFSDAKIKI